MALELAAAATAASLVRDVTETVGRIVRSAHENHRVHMQDRAQLRRQLAALAEVNAQRELNLAFGAMQLAQLNSEAACYAAIDDMSASVPADEIAEMYASVRKMGSMMRIAGFQLAQRHGRELGWGV